MPTGKVREDHLIVKYLTVDGVAVTGGALLSGSQAIDLAGVADSLVLDDDGDTTISAPTDDQIDIEVAGADDFQITANTFTALSGSTIKTNTIAETTSASGVTIDGALIKDGVVVALNAIAAVTDDGAIAVPSSDTTYFITENSDGAVMTLVDPTATTHDGLRLTFISTTAQAHSLDLVTGVNGGAADVGTFGGAVGDAVAIVAYQGVWYALPGQNVNVSWA